MVIAVEPSGKGDQSIAGLRSVVTGIEDSLQIDVGVLAVVPNRFEGTNDQETVVAEVADSEYPSPVTIRKRTSLFEGCWQQQCSAFQYVETHRDPEREYEVATLDRLETLAAYLEEVGQV